jgi:hypothetical protein
MKIGDLVRSVDQEDDTIGIVSSIAQLPVSDRVDVFWGPLPFFGRRFEWDWDFNLEVVEESGC